MNDYKGVLVLPCPHDPDVECELYAECLSIHNDNVLVKCIHYPKKSIIEIGVGENEKRKFYKQKLEKLEKK